MHSFYLAHIANKLFEEPSYARISEFLGPKRISFNSNLFLHELFDEPSYQSHLIRNKGLTFLFLLSPSVEGHSFLCVVPFASVF